MTANSSNQLPSGFIHTNCPICTQNVRQHLYISLNMTNAIIKSRVKELEDWDYKDIYLYVVTIIPLQVAYFMCGDFWVIDMNLQCKNTHKNLYAIAHKYKEKYHGYEMGLNDKLYTDKQIYNETKLTQLPRTKEFSKEIQCVRIMENIMNDEDTNIQKLFKKQQWHTTKVVINTKECNKGERRYHILKNDFIKKLNHVAESKYIRLAHVLVFNDKTKCYLVDGLWIVQIDNELTIGISFRYFEENVIKATAIYVDVGIARVHCKLSGQPCGILLDGWDKSKWNNITVGDRPKEICESKLKEEVKRDLKRDLKREIKREWKQEMKREMEQKIRQEMEQRVRQEMRQETEQKMQTLTTDKESLIKYILLQKEIYPKPVYEVDPDLHEKVKVQIMNFTNEESKNLILQMKNIFSRVPLEQLPPDLSKSLQGFQDDQKTNSENGINDASITYNYANKLIKNVHGSNAGKFVHIPSKPSINWTIPNYTYK